MSTFRTYAEVSSLIADLEGERLPKERWTHEAHLAAGLWYVWHLGADGALLQLRRRIARHNVSVGTPNTDSSGYHETITRLYIRGIADLILPGTQEHFDCALVRVLESALSNSTWPLSLYTKDRLFSPTARKEWLCPDL
jgi:hypothetical protein